MTIQELEFLDDDFLMSIDEFHQFFDVSKCSLYFYYLLHNFPLGWNMVDENATILLKVHLIANCSLEIASIGASRSS